MNLDYSTTDNMVRVEMPLDEFAHLVDAAVRWQKLMGALGESYGARQEAGSA